MQWITIDWEIIKKEEKNKIQDLPKKTSFIKYEKKERFNNKSDKIVSVALNALEDRDHLWAKHCTDWINKVYLKNKISWCL